MRKHWYKKFYQECPACGRSSQYKVRCFGKKPKRHDLRHVFKETYDFCIERGNL